MSLFNTSSNKNDYNIKFEKFPEEENKKNSYPEYKIYLILIIIFLTSLFIFSAVLNKYILLKN